MRRHASEWAGGLAATKYRSFWVPRASCSLKAMAVSTRVGESRCAPSGVSAYGTLEEDGPGTWGGPHSSWQEQVGRRPGSGYDHPA